MSILPHNKTLELMVAAVTLERAKTALSQHLCAGVDNTPEALAQWRVEYDLLNFEETVALKEYDTLRRNYLRV